jgi:hypothetical protein
MLIPLTDPEHPLAKQMIRLIGAHSHLPETIDAEEFDAGPYVIEDSEGLRTRRGRTLVRRVTVPSGLAAATSGL